MRKILIVCLLLSVLLLLCACNQNFAVSGDPSSSNSERNPIISSDPSSSAMNPTTECTKHTFPKDTYVCSVCGIDYFSATLEFTLSDTRDSYIVSDVGTCAASEIVIPATYKGLPVTEIGEGAFRVDVQDSSVHSSCRNITQVTIPSSVQIIGAAAFRDCRSLKTVIDAGGVTVIDRMAFANCWALESITLPETLTTIGSFAFRTATALKTIDIPRGVTFIGDSAFVGAGITRLELSMDAATIEAYMVSNCHSLEEIRISGGITKIPEEFAAHCDSLKTVILGGNVVSIGKGAFAWCGELESMDLGDNLESIGASAFSRCTSLRTISLPKTLKHLGGMAFYKCPIETIEIPNELETVDEANSFLSCDQLKYHEYKGMGYVGSQQNPYMILVCQLDPTVKHVEVHEDTRFVQDGAVRNTEVTTLTLGESTEMFPIEKILDQRIKANRIIKLDVVPENKKFRMVNDCLIEIASKTLLLGFENPVIPDDGSVTVINEFAFRFLKGLKSVVIPDTVEVIGANAFDGCINLEWFVIGKGVKKIEHEILLEASKVSVFYMGSAEDWEKISIVGYPNITGMETNYGLLEAPRYYYTETAPTEEGNFWHYVDGIPTPWKTEE